MLDVMDHNPSTTNHTVAWGETLATIARDYYSNADMAAEIYHANRDVIPDPNSLQPYTVLVLRLPFKRAHT